MNTFPPSKKLTLPFESAGSVNKLWMNMRMNAQARKTFVSDVNRCCAIVELAFYPPKGKAFDLSLNDFVLRVIGTDTAAEPSSARLSQPLYKKRRPGTATSRYPPVSVLDMAIMVTIQ
jgi:hypothetical protein